MNHLPESSIEVTEGDFKRYVKVAKKGRFRLRNLFPPTPPQYATTSNASLASMDNLASVAASSVAAFTITSHETVKASNRSAPPSRNDASKQQKDGHNNWPRLKNPFRTNKMGEPSSNEESKARATHISNKSALVSVLRRRSKKTKTDENYLETSSYHASLDDAIRGRLDGMDVLSLGPARLPCFVAVKTDDTPIDKFLRALNPRLTAASLVKDMIYTSAGRSPPEMILEGFFDRWFVKIHLDPEILIPSPSKDETCGSAVCGGDASLDNLVERMWGKHQPPPQEESNENEKDVLQLAAECNVPIDLDEDSFIIETHQHWQAVHDILCIPLGRGDFESALTILGKILQGQSHPQHQAATRHNMALVYMWQNNYSAALAFLEQAVALRNLSVSLFRQGLCLWALGRLDMAITCLRQALDKHPAENATRAKLCNNIGVLFYSRGNLMQALEYFTKALEMQRQWLDCKVKRESIIFDASTTLNNMGKLYLNKKDYDAAEVVFEEALVTTAFRKESPIVMQSLGNLAWTKAKSGQFKVAIQMLNGLLSSQEEYYGKDSREYCETLGLLGHLYCEKEDYEPALKYLTSCRDSLEKLGMAKTHIAVSAISEMIRKVENKLQSNSVWI